MTSVTPEAEIPEHDAVLGPEPRAAGATDTLGPSTNALHSTEPGDIMNTNADDILRLKFHSKREIRVVAVDKRKDVVSFRNLKQRLIHDYGFDLSLAYHDNEGDLITLASQNDLNELLATHEKTANVRVIPIGDKLEDDESVDKGNAMRGGASRTHPSQSAMKQDIIPQIHTVISAPTPTTSGAASLDPLAPAPQHEMYVTAGSRAASASMVCSTTSPAKARLLQSGTGITENRSGRATIAALDPLRVSAIQEHAPVCPAHQDTVVDSSSCDNTGPSDPHSAKAEVRLNDEESVGCSASLGSKSGRADIAALDPLYVPTIQGPASSKNLHQHPEFEQSIITNTAVTDIDILRHEDKNRPPAETSIGATVLDNYGEEDSSTALDSRCVPAIQREATALAVDQKRRHASSSSERALQIDRCSVRAEEPRGSKVEPAICNGYTQFGGSYGNDDIQGSASEAAAATCRNRVDAVTSAPAVAPVIMPSVRNIRWQRGNLIGQGAFGRVYMTLNLDTGELMAMKQLDTASVSSRERCALENEISMMKGLRHPNIVRYIGVDSSNDTLAIFLEYVPGGSLRSLLDRFGKLEEAIVRLYSRQILLGLEYLHSKGIAHRDIKAANVLVSNDGSVKLADFGASKRIAASSHANGVAATGGAKGTPLWMAPEVKCTLMTSDKHCSLQVIKDSAPKGGQGWRKADVWSLGATIIEMATGRPPWSQYSNPVTAMYHIACVEQPPEMPRELSEDGHQFLWLCFQRNSRLRPEVSSLLLQNFAAVAPTAWRELHAAEDRNNHHCTTGLPPDSLYPSRPSTTSGAETHRSRRSSSIRIFNNQWSIEQCASSGQSFPASYGENAHHIWKAEAPTTLRGSHNDGSQEVTKSRCTRSNLPSPMTPYSASATTTGDGSRASSGSPSVHDAASTHSQGLLLIPQAMLGKAKDRCRRRRNRTDLDLPTSSPSGKSSTIVALADSPSQQQQVVTQPDNTNGVITASCVTSVLVSGDEVVVSNAAGDSPRECLHPKPGEERVASMANTAAEVATTAAMQGAQVKQVRSKGGRRVVGKKRNSKTSTLRAPRQKKKGEASFTALSHPKDTTEIMNGGTAGAAPIVTVRRSVSRLIPTKSRQLSVSSSTQHPTSGQVAPRMTSCKLSGNVLHNAKTPTGTRPAVVCSSSNGVDQYIHGGRISFTDEGYDQGQPAGTNPSSRSVETAHKPHVHIENERSRAQMTRSTRGSSRARMLLRSKDGLKSNAKVVTAAPAKISVRQFQDDVVIEDGRDDAEKEDLSDSSTRAGGTADPHAVRRKSQMRRYSDGAHSNSSALVAHAPGCKLENVPITPVLYGSSAVLGDFSALGLRRDKRQVGRVESAFLQKKAKSPASWNMFSIIDDLCNRSIESRSGNSAKHRRTSDMQPSSNPMVRSAQPSMYRLDSMFSSNSGLGSKCEMPNETDSGIETDQPDAYSPKPPPPPVASEDEFDPAKSESNRSPTTEDRGPSGALFHASTHENECTSLVRKSSSVFSALEDELCDDASDDKSSASEGCGNTAKMPLYHSETSLAKVSDLLADQTLESEVDNEDRAVPLSGASECDYDNDFRSDDSYLSDDLDDNVASQFGDTDHSKGNSTVEQRKTGHVSTPARNSFSALEPALIIQHDAPFLRMSIASRAPLLAAGAADGMTFLVHTGTPDVKVVALLKPVKGASDSGSNSASFDQPRASTCPVRRSAETLLQQRRIRPQPAEETDSRLAMGAFSLSADGSRLVTTEGCSGRIWDVATGSVTHHLEGHQGKISCAVIVEASPSIGAVTGSQKSRVAGGASSQWAGCVVTGSTDNSVRLWDARMRRPQILALRGHSDSINALHIDFDKSCAWSASQDTCIRAWDLRSGRCRFHLTQHFGSVQCLAFDPSLDGGHGGILSGARDTSVNVWSRVSGTCMRTLRSQRGFVQQILVCPQSAHSGSSVACASSNGRVRLWDHHQGRCLRSFVGHTQGVTCISWIGNDHAEGGENLLVSGSGDATIRIWQPRSGSLTRTIRAHKSAVVDIHAEGVSSSSTSCPRVFSASSDGTLRLTHF